jgi:hypothetical protein
VDPDPQRAGGRHGIDLRRTDAGRRLFDNDRRDRDRLWARAFFVPGYELALTLLGASVTIQLTGPGRFSIETSSVMFNDR